MVVYGSCSVINKTKSGAEEIIICPQRLYANGYETLKYVVQDAMHTELPLYMADEYSRRKSTKELPNDYIVLLGQRSGKEITLSNPGFIPLNLDWVMVHVVSGKIALVIPCGYKASTPLATIGLTGMLTQRN